MARNVPGGPVLGFPRGFTADDFAEIGRLTVDLGNAAQEVVLTRDPEKAARIREEDDATDSLHRHLFFVLMDRHCHP